MVIANFRYGHGPLSPAGTRVGTRKRMRMMDSASYYSCAGSSPPSSAPSRPAPSTYLNKRRKLIGSAQRERRQQRHRLVSFAVAEGVAKDGLANVRADVKVFHPETPQDLSTLWWTRAERGDICARARRIVDTHKDEHSDSVEDMLDAFDRIVAETAAATRTATAAAAAAARVAASVGGYCSDSDSDSDSEDDDCPQHDIAFGPPPSVVYDDEPCCQDEPPIVVPMHARGLEWGFIPSVKAARRSHAKAVMNAQDDCVCHPLPELALAAVASRSSRPSRVMARLIAQGDAHQAAGLELGLDASSSSSCSPCAGPLFRCYGRHPLLPLPLPPVSDESSSDDEDEGRYDSERSDDDEDEDGDSDSDGEEQDQLAVSLR